ncbi:hypothetical protein WCLP8_1810008 [uncultured Gammaproteobacteria bacterium]
MTGARLVAVEGDITGEAVDTIVNAANSDLTVAVVPMPPFTEPQGRNDNPRSTISAAAPQVNAG